MLKYYSTFTAHPAFRCLRAAAITTMLSAAMVSAQEDETDDLPVTPPGVIAIENDAVIEAGPDGELILENRRGPKIAGPAGVIISAPDEEIIIEGKPRPPGSPDAPQPPRKKLKIKDKSADASVEQRLSRLERMIENLAENDRMTRKHAFEFNGKEFARVQKEIDRAMRDADRTVKRMNPGPGGKDDFVFEHKFEFEGHPKMQRKMIEAQRKALEKQMEALDKQMEALEKLQDEAAESEAEFESDIEKEEALETKPALPPDTAPENP